MNNPVKGSACQSTPWNKGKLVGQKAPLRVSEIWAIRVRLEIFGRIRDLALFNLAIDSKLRGCDLVQLRVNDVCHGGHVAARASVMQQKTKQPVQFELTAGTRKSLEDWIAAAALLPRRFSLSQSILRIAAPFDSAVRTYCPPMVRRNRVRPDGIQHAHDAED